MLSESQKATSLREQLSNAHPSDAAKLLLGHVLTIGEHKALIIEAEGYDGYNDPGSHAYRGPTPRTNIMFGPAGFVYMYFTYGNHWMFCITCRQSGQAGAVLIRALYPLTDPTPLFIKRPKARKIEYLLNGPGKLCQAYGIGREHYGIDLFDTQAAIRLSETAIQPPSSTIETTRIGLREGAGDTYLWRHLHRDYLAWVSGPRISD